MADETAFNEGVQAAKEGRPISDNDYDADGPGDPQAEEYRLWREGWYYENSG